MGPDAPSDKLVWCAGLLVRRARFLPRALEWRRIRAMLDACPDTLRGKRDRALLALGFAGVFRRSELVAVGVADLIEGPDPERTKQLLYNIAVAWLRARDKDLREEECA